MDYAANLALFLTEKKGSCLATWRGRLTAKEQRALFGQYLGKGTIWIDGTAETIEHWVTTCFGLDGECTNRLTFNGINLPSDNALMAALGPCDK